MDLTNETILSQLKLKKAQLMMELNRVNLAIDAFEEVDINNMNELEILAINPDLHSEFEADTDLEPKPILYHAKMSYEHKILWALGKMQTATASEITDYLIRFDGAVRNRTRFLQGIVFTASRMFKFGKINAEKRSRVNIYSLEKV